MSFKNSLRLVVGGGTDLLRAGIRRIVADMPEIEIVNECLTAQSAMQAIREQQPDVVLMNFYLNSGSAVEVLQECRATKPRPVALVYTQFSDPGIRAISYAAGADVFYDGGEDLGPLIKMLRKLAMALVEAEREKLVA